MNKKILDLIGLIGCFLVFIFSTVWYVLDFIETKDYYLFIPIVCSFLGTLLLFLAIFKYLKMEEIKEWLKSNWRLILVIALIVFIYYIVFQRPT